MTINRDAILAYHEGFVAASQKVDWQDNPYGYATGEPNVSECGLAWARGFNEYVDLEAGEHGRRPRRSGIAPGRETLARRAGYKRWSRARARHGRSMPR